MRRINGIIFLVENCVFCQIVARAVPADFVYQDEKIAVFKSIDPKAPTHLIITPKEHIEELKDLSDKTLLAIKDKAIDLVEKNNLSPKGYRLAINGGAAKAVLHLHFHLLGGVEIIREV